MLGHLIRQRWGWGATIVATLCVLGLLVAGLRFGVGGPEDSWNCVDGTWVRHGNPASPAPDGPCGTENEPTNFARTGVVVFNNPGLKPNVPYLISEAPGQPALMTELVFDPLSACTATNGSAPCIAMSASPDIAFGGKRALVEGIERSGTVLVRTLRIAGDEELLLAPRPGSVFISWPQAVVLIQQCNVSGVMQTHGLDVYLTLKDGRRLRAVEPVIDTVFDIVDRSQVMCGSITLATE